MSFSSGSKSIDEQREVLMDILNKHLNGLDQAKPPVPPRKSSSRPRGGIREKKTLQLQVHVRSSIHEGPPVPPKPEKRSSRVNASERTASHSIGKTYERPTGPEIVSLHTPSCAGLPPTWTPLHDRFIAYLATHSPLDSPRHSLAFYKTTDIARLVSERFPRLSRFKIKAQAIETRLAMLDQAGDNDYFRMKERAYEREEWGRGI